MGVAMPTDICYQACEQCCFADKYNKRLGSDFHSIRTDWFILMQRVGDDLQFEL